MDIDMVRSLMTVATLAAFVGVFWWAYAPGRKARFERDAELPFDADDAVTDGAVPGGEGKGATASWRDL